MLAAFSDSFYKEYLRASVAYFLLSVDRSWEFYYFGMKDSGFCRPFPLHINNFNAGEYLLVSHVRSFLLARDVTFLLFLLIG